MHKGIKVQLVWTGPQGPQGNQGPQGTNGNGIASTTDNGDGTFTFTYDDGATSVINVQDADSDSGNELQNIYVSNDSLFLSQSNGIPLSTIGTGNSSSSQHLFGNSSINFSSYWNNNTSIIDYSGTAAWGVVLNLMPYLPERHGKL